MALFDQEMWMIHRNHTKDWLIHASGTWGGHEDEYPSTNRNPSPNIVTFSHPESCQLLSSPRYIFTVYRKIDCIHTCTLKVPSKLGKHTINTFLWRKNWGSQPLSASAGSNFRNHPPIRWLIMSVSRTPNHHWKGWRPEEYPPSKITI